MKYLFLWKDYLKIKAIKKSLKLKIILKQQKF
jgi:hypothetical protein